MIWVIRWTKELNLSRNGNECKPLGDGLSVVTNNARLECLRHVELLHALTDDQRVLLMRFLQPQQYAENEVIFRQGDTGRASKSSTS